MTDISIQLHALPEEVAAFAQKCMDDFNLYAIAMRFFPFEASEITSEEMGKLAQVAPFYGEVALSLKKPLLPAAQRADLMRNNPDVLRFTLERESPAGLRQATLSARTNDPAALAVWKKIASRMKRITKTGVIAMNPDTGATTPTRTFRYTSGAKALASAGVRMLPIAGGNVLILAEVKSEGPNDGGPLVS
ncbi:hypothetical protein [Polaromonas sp.]|uniref:hypothetical protein n=1 Tax=Polaromonas sp. TaxID=1869339 RepID=UPI0032634BE4